MRRRWPVPASGATDTSRALRTILVRLAGSLAVGIVLTGAATMISAAIPVAAAQGEDLRIVVLEGEDSVNVLGQGTAVPTVVEVRDRNDLPVFGASVVFLLGEGGTATLNAGLSQVALTTNALGQAAVTVNPLASGAVQLQVSAAFQGQTATAAIVQTNVTTAAAAGGAAGGAAGTAGAGGGTGGGAGGATGAAAGGGTGGGLGTGGVVGVVAGSVGAAVAGVAVARGAAPAPPVAALRIAPHGLGMAGVTEYRFDASDSSDPNRDALTYSWEFGDGGRGTGVTVTHVYEAAGTYAVTVTVSDGSGETRTSGSVKVGQNVEGRFVGIEGPGLFDDSCGSWRTTLTLDLRQHGRTLSGNLESLSQPQSGHCSPHYYFNSVRGSLESSSNFVCPCDIRLDVRYTGYRGPGRPLPQHMGEERWHGIVLEDANAIDFGFIIYHRQ